MSFDTMMLVDYNLGAFLVVGGIAFSVGYLGGISFAYWKDKTFGGKTMVMKNDVVDDGERKPGLIAKMMKGRQPTIPEPKQVEYPPEPVMPVQPEPQRHEIEVDVIFQNMVSDLRVISEHLGTIAANLDYIRGYLKGKGVI
jgi:hypothetical protein